MEVEKKNKSVVPENILKKQARDSKVRDQKTKLRTERKTKNADLRKQYTTRGQKYAKEYKDAELNLVKEKRQAKLNNSFYVPAEAKVALVVRIRGIMGGIKPDLKKILQLLRLRQINNAVLVRINKATTNMLVKVLPYITFGYPTKKTISDLLYKRGNGRVANQRIPLVSNEIIEKALGKFDIICMEDLIHELVTLGPNFKQANNFVWPFKLRNPKGGFSCKRHSFQNGGDWGNREEEINALVKRML